MPSHSPGTVPEARQDAVLKRYPLRRLRIPLGTGSLSLVTPDAGAWVRQGTWTSATLRGAEPPYWVQIWPASVAVAQLLWRCGSLAGIRALDLGCGLGVPGIAAASLGADVTFADRERDALAFAEWNARRQGIATHVVARPLDWSREELQEPVDLLLLADVSYRPVHHAGLRRHVERCVAAGGVVVHADPGRRESTPFVHWMQEAMVAMVATRPTSFEHRRLSVRLCVAAGSAGVLERWRRPLGLAAAASTQPEAGAAS